MRRLMICCLALVLGGCAWTVKVEQKVEATSGVLEITKITSEPVPEFYPTPTPDGKALLVTVRDTGKRGAEQWSIVSIRIGQTGRQHVAGPYASQPTWMPDGNSFVYTYTKQGNSRLVKSAKGSAITYISSAPFGEADASADISPDGTKIVFETVVGNEWMIATSGVDGSLFTLLCPGRNPHWRPDGGSILFSRGTGEYTHIFTIDLASGQVTQLTDGKYNDLFPCWSPDGGWIAFISDREDGRPHLFVMSDSGDSVTRYTTGATDEILPAWSSDGYIYFCSNAGGKSASPELRGQLPTTWDYSDIWRIKPILPK